MEARELNGNDLDRWDDLVEGSAQGTVFQKRDWLRIFKEHFDLPLKVYGCFDGDTLVGGCAGYVKKKNVLNGAFVSCSPLTPYGSLMVANYPEHSVRATEKRNGEIIRALIDAIEKERFHNIVIKNSPGLRDIRPFTWAGWTARVNYTYILDIASLSLESFERNARTCIKKGAKNGYVIREANDPAAHYRLFAAMLGNKGIKPVAGPELFENVLGGCGRKALGEMWVAETPAGETASSQIITCDNKMAYIWSEATDPVHRGMGPNCQLQYEVLQNLARRGYTRVDMMRANIPELSSYASQYNPSLAPCYVVERSGRPYKIARAIF